MNAELKYWFLRDHKLFRNLSFSEINSLCILKRFKKSKKDEVVELPYSEKEKVYFLKLGTLKLVKIDEHGDEVLVEIIQKGDLFGELNFDKEDEQQEFMKVVSDEAIICTFFRDKLEEIMLRKPDFAINYIKFIGFNYKKIQNSYRNIFFKDAKTRLLLLLQMLVEKEDLQTNTFTIPPYLTQKDIAQLICTTRQTVIRLFHELETDGILSHSQNQLIIPDIGRFHNFLQNVK